MSSPTAVFTVDVEDWYHGSAVPSIRHGSASRLAHGLMPLLDLLDEFHAKATFFWLGAAAAQNPALVREVASRGHDLGVHGYEHVRAPLRSPEVFRLDTRKAIQSVEDCSGCRVTCYRAPYFSLTPSMTWAFEELANAGISVDSSIRTHIQAGVGLNSGKPSVMETTRGHILELPVPCLPIGAQSVAMSGSSILRVLPYSVAHGLFRKLATTNGVLNFYVHPWELDQDRPYASFSRGERFRNSIGAKGLHQKLRRLLSDWKFDSLGKALASHMQAR